MADFLPEPETRGGLDRYLGPTAAGGSNLPIHLEPGTAAAENNADEPDTSDALKDLAEAERAKQSERP